MLYGVYSSGPGLKRLAVGRGFSFGHARLKKQRASGRCEWYQIRACESFFCSHGHAMFDHVELAPLRRGFSYSRLRECPWGGEVHLSARGYFDGALENAIGQSRRASTATAFPPTINLGTSNRNRFISRSLKRDLCGVSASGKRNHHGPLIAAGARKNEKLNTLVVHGTRHYHV
jgi:hypothetical protein